MLLHRIIKTPPTPETGLGWRPPQRQQHKRLTETELVEIFTKSPFNANDFVYYSTSSPQTTDVYRMGYIFEVNIDEATVEYAHDGTPKLFAILPLAGASRIYESLNVPARPPIFRWDTCEGYSLLNEDIKNRAIDDYVQNYVQKWAEYGKKYFVTGKPEPRPNSNYPRLPFQP